MSDDEDSEEFNAARFALGRVRTHEPSDKTPYGRPDLKQTQKIILDYVEQDEWTNRSEIVDELGMSPAAVKRHLGEMVENSYLNVRPDPTDSRKKQYQET